MNDPKELKHKFVIKFQNYLEVDDCTIHFPKEFNGHSYVAVAFKTVFVNSFTIMVIDI